MVQWLTIHLTIKGSWIRSLVEEDPTCHTSNKTHTTTTTELPCHNYWSQVALEPTLHKTEVATMRSSHTATKSSPRLPQPGAFLVAQLVKTSPAKQETWVQSLGWEDAPGGGHGNLLQYSCLENLHGQRSLAGYSPWGWLQRIRHDWATELNWLNIKAFFIKRKFLNE